MTVSFLNATSANAAYTSGTHTPGAYESGQADPGAYTSGTAAPAAYNSGDATPGAYSSSTHSAGAFTSDSGLPAICRNLVAATPDADVAYQPGTDTHGNKVAPADLPSTGPTDLGQNIDFPLTVNLARTLGLRGYPYNRFGAGTEGYIGTLSVRDNKAYFNGQPLSDPEQDRLAVLCMKPR